jgi:Ca2+-binding RTX toxin-like protein
MIEAHGRNKPKSEGAERLSAMQAIAKVETGFSNRKIGLVVTAVLGVVAYFSSFLGQAEVAWEEEGPPKEPDQPTTVAAPFEGRIDRQEAPEDEAPARRTAEEGALPALPAAAPVQGPNGAGAVSSLLAKAEAAMPPAHPVGTTPSVPSQRMPSMDPGQDTTPGSAGTSGASSGGGAGAAQESADRSDGSDGGESGPSAPDRPGASDTPPQTETPPAPDQPVATTAAAGQALWGTSGNDILIGSLRDDAIKSLGGDDIIDGQEGDDVIEGGAGHDMIMGGAGRDILFGNEGQDRLAGGEGDDILDGGAGDDIILDGTGQDLVSGGDGNDRLVISRDHAEDLFQGDAGHDTLILSEARQASVLDLGAGTVSLDGGPQDRFLGIEAFALGGAQDTVLLSSASAQDATQPAVFEIDNFGRDDLFVLSDEVTLTFDDIFAQGPTQHGQATAATGQSFFKITDFVQGDRVEGTDQLRTALDGAENPAGQATTPQTSELEPRIARSMGEDAGALNTHLQFDMPIGLNIERRKVAVDIDQNGTSDFIVVVSTTSNQDLFPDTIV